MSCINGTVSSWADQCGSRGLRPITVSRYGGGCVREAGVFGVRTAFGEILEAGEDKGQPAP